MVNFLRVIVSFCAKMFEVEECLRAELEAERRRSKALMKALYWYWLYWNDSREEIRALGYKVAEKAIAEYEASLKR